MDAREATVRCFPIASGRRGNFFQHWQGPASKETRIVPCCDLWSGVSNKLCQLEIDGTGRDRMGRLLTDSMVHYSPPWHRHLE